MRLYDLGERIARRAQRLPVLGSLLARDYQRQFHHGHGRYHGVYASFEEARRAIPPHEKVGFDHDELAAMYRNRIKACPSDYPVLYWLRRVLEPGAVVFDFGGHIGISYHGWRPYLDDDPTLRWTVYDLPAITRAGEAYARAHPSPGLAFTNALGDARDCTVFLAAGSLQFVDRALPALLAEAGARPRHVLVNKLPLHDGAPYVTVQSAGTAFHPYQIGNREDFITGMVELGYELVDEWSNADLSCRIPFAPVEPIEAYTGCYFRQASARASR